MNLLRLRKGPIVGISKRISVPENFAYFAAQQAQQQQPNLPQSQVLFQQRLMQQQQKRAAGAAAPVPAPVAAGMRHRSGSWSTRHAASKYLQHQVRKGSLEISVLSDKMNLTVRLGKLFYVYLPCCPAPNCLGKQEELSENCVPNLTVRFILSPSNSEAEIKGRHDAHVISTQSYN